MAILLPIITIICMLGIYSSDQLTLSLYLMCLFGIIGYFMRSCDYPLAPVILGVVLGTRMEESFRQTMIMNQGNFFQIFDRPIVLIFFGSYNLLYLFVFTFSLYIITHYDAIVKLFFNNSLILNKAISLCLASSITSRSSPWKSIGFI